MAHHFDVDAFPPKNLEDLCTQVFSQDNLNMHTGHAAAPGKIDTAHALNDWTAAHQTCITVQLLIWLKGRKAMVERQEGNG